FFRTLAEAHGASAVGIVLSGTGSDGSNGIKRVKENGGLVIAQQPDEAEHGDMPRHAIATGLVDFVLPAAQIADAVHAFAQRLTAPPGDAPAASAQHRDPVRAILQLVRLASGQDFSHYKQATVLRRIERRVSLLELPD